MKIKNIILSIVLSYSLFSCYEDLGNYDYKEINAITVKGIEARYEVDVDDSLKIYPSLEGTIYSDTSKFSYEWEIARKVIAQTHDLELLVNIIPGDKSGRFIITDKATGHKTYHRFDVRVSSSTAGDLIVVLSKYQGRAELSYYRLDKPSNFAVNYYSERFGSDLGTNPQQLHIRYSECPKGLGFCNSFGRVMTLVDDEIKLIDKSTMRPDTIYGVLNEQSYFSNVSYPKPDIKDYKSQYIVEEGITMWRKNAYGGGSQHNTNFYEISNGKLYYATHSNFPQTWSSVYSYDLTSPYNNGPFSPFTFYDQMDPTPHDNNKQAGYKTGNLMLFDYKAGRFAYGSGTRISEIIPSRMEFMTGYQLVYGSATVMPDNTFVCVLSNGSNSKMLLMKRTTEVSTERDKDNVYSIIGQVNCNNTILNEKTRYYTTKYSNYLYFTQGNKLYRYNMTDIGAGTIPGEQHVVAKLTDFGYDANAKITSMYFSRSENTILLGISRYGEDAEAEGEEAKGDILAFSYNSSNMQITLQPKYTFKGISGIPVDLKIKYQTHWRDGKNFDDVLVDNI